MPKQQQKNQHKPRIIRGVLSVNSRAVGFVSDEKGKDDIMIETPNLATALHRDEVEVEILPSRIRGRRTGRVIRIIKRAKTRFVGTIEERGTRLVLVPDDFRMYAPLVIQKPPREARRGLKAFAELSEWKPGKEPNGNIIKIIGEKGGHETEMQSIALERGFEESFPQEVLCEAETISKREWPIPEAEIKPRRDFRGALLFTIDPKDAKDFDDALSFRRLSDTEVKDKGLRIKDSLYEVGVHIADVSHYVREGSTLDREARERGTSVYLVDRTIPMLPHALSNELCSLKPNEDRLAFSAVFEIDAQGKVHSRWFGKTVIHSKRRFTYEDAQEIIDNRHFCRSQASTGSPVSIPAVTFAKELQTLNAIAKNLRAEKMRKGAIDFEHDEVGFELDKDGRPLRVFKKERLDTHRLVEEFMLLANREVAEFFFMRAARGGADTSFIYRIHDTPDAEKLEQLRVFVRALGHELPLGKKGALRGKDLQQLFQKIEGHAAESLIKTAAIRSMAKAIYSTANIGHFGLAFEYYTHFTSPIRRYPDLMAHRLLHAALAGRAVRAEKLLGLQRIAEKATEREIAASEAERESVKLKQVEFMREFVGKEFDGTISGVTEWGIYIEEKKTKAEGMAALRDISGDHYILDEKNYQLVGERTKKKYALGDAVRFRVAGADIERKMLDYTLLT